MSTDGADTPERKLRRLAGAHEFVLERSPKVDALSILSPEGTVVLRIRVTETGLDVELAGASLRLRTEGDLTLDAQQLTLRGRESVDIQAERRIRLQAEERTIAATLGDVTIEAQAWRAPSAWRACHSTRCCDMLA